MRGVKKPTDIWLAINQVAWILRAKDFASETLISSGSNNVKFLYIISKNDMEQWYCPILL